MKILNQAKDPELEDSEPEPPYDHEPFFFYPATCPSCDGEGCMMCKEQASFASARLGLPDMTIKRHL